MCPWDGVKSIQYHKAYVIQQGRIASEGKVELLRGGNNDIPGAECIDVGTAGPYASIEA